MHQSLYLFAFMKFMLSCLVIGSKHHTFLKYYRINSEEDGREACAILHAAGPSKVCFINLDVS